MVGGLVLLVLIAGAAGYFYLTKSQSVNVRLEKGEKYRIAGKYYEGKYGDRQLEKIFGDMRTLLQQGDIAGELAVLYYGDPHNETGKVKNFIGILPEQGAKIPESLEVRTYTPDHTLTIAIHSHPLVMPRPTRVRSMMEDEAEQNGYELDSIFLEKYLGNEDIVVMRHLRKAGN